MQKELNGNLDNRHVAGNPMKSRFVLKFIKGFRRTLRQLDTSTKSSSVISSGDMSKFCNLKSLNEYSQEELLYLKTFIAVGFWLCLRYSEIASMTWSAIRIALEDNDGTHNFTYHRIYLFQRKG